MPIASSVVSTPSSKARLVASSTSTNVAAAFDGGGRLGTLGATFSALAGTGAVGGFVGTGGGGVGRPWPSIPSCASVTSCALPSTGRSALSSLGFARLLLG